jgi:hypothetical protein
MILLILVAIATALTLGLKLSNPRGPTTPVTTTTAPTLEPTQTPAWDPLVELISSASSDGGVALADPSTPQCRALEWLAGDPNLANFTDHKKIQRYALATLYFSTNGDGWEYNNDWLSDKDVCGNWYQKFNTTIKCTSNDTVSSLNHDGNKLQGTIPPEISMLSDAISKCVIENYTVKLCVIPSCS